MQGQRKPGFVITRQPREAARDNGAALTEIQMNAGNKGVHEEHEDHHAEDGHALHQEHLVSYSVLLRRNRKGRHV